jgi:DNA-binding MarR family transcriptional regulator
MLAGKQLISHMSARSPQPPSQTELASRLRAAIGALSRGLRQTAAGSELTPSQTSVLFTIVRRGPTGLSELAQIEGINPTMLSRVIAQLRERGLISRSYDPQDRRATVVKATSAGRRTHERIYRERTQAIARHLDSLEQRQLRALENAVPALEELARQVKLRRP